jgi:hypothetical protein
MHMQECFPDPDYRIGDSSISERAANITLALPIYPELCAEVLGAVVQMVASFVKSLEK